MGNDERLWERARVRAQSESTTLTSYPLPPEEGEDNIISLERINSEGKLPERD